MIRKKIKKKILKKSTTHFLLPIEQAGSYYRYLKSRYGNKLNPFKMLANEIHCDSERFFITCTDSEIKLSMNQFHILRYFRQNFAYLNVSKNLSCLRNFINIDI